VFNKILEDINFDSVKKIKLLEEFDKVLGLNVKEMQELKLNLPNDVKEMIKEREKLRENKKWVEADIVRERIKELGYIIEDKSDGIRVEKI